MAIVIPAPPQAPSEFAKCHPLVCDPFLGNRRLLRETLKDMGCGRVDDVVNLSEAWKRIEAGGNNVLFLDWSEQTDAMTFLRTIRHPTHPHRFLPVIVMTAYAGVEYVFAARDSGATEFMLRPWSNQVVESRLRSVVQHPRLFIDGGRFFGPDRRRRRADYAGPERRNHENWRSGDRRHTGSAWDGPERRQGRPGFAPLERRNAPRA